MKDFFSSIRFKILVGVAIVLCAFMLRAAWTGGFGTLTSSVLGAITAPLQKVSSSISGAVGGFLDGFANAGRLRQENEELKEQMRELNEKIVDYDEMKHQNEVYNELWKIRDKYQDIEFEPAQVIGNDSSDRFYSFTIDKGQLDGIDLRDSVHTPSGFVGVVTEVGLTYSKVSTILDPAVNISVYDTRTRDTGVISGTVELAEQGLCKLSYLPRESGAAKGDLVATSGVSGRYPKDQIVGRIVEVHAESHGNSLYAIIEPTADIKKVKDVIVVKSFVGQGDSTVAITQTPQASNQGEDSPENQTSSEENSPETASGGAESTASSSRQESASSRPENSISAPQPPAVSSQSNQPSASQTEPSRAENDTLPEVNEPEAIPREDEGLPEDSNAAPEENAGDEP